MKEDLMFSHMGSGISICDRNREEHTDYMKVAHIGRNRKITYYGKQLSKEATASIEYYGKYENSSASVTQPYRVLDIVEFSKIDVIELKAVFQEVLSLRINDPQLEVAVSPNENKTIVFATKEATEFLQKYYKYMHTEVKEGIYHWQFVMYDKGNYNYQ